MFKIVINNGKENLPDDDIFYIITKNGVFLKKKLDLIESLVKVDTISFLEDLQPFVKLNIPKIPSKLFHEIVSFFHAIQNKQNAECMVILYYNQNTKKFRAYAPPQQVSGSSIHKYENDVNKFPDYTKLGTIHSHSNFSAFYSAVDDVDEFLWDGLHITVGNVDDIDNCTIRASVVSNKFREILNPLFYIEGITKVEKKQPFLAYGNLNSWQQNLIEQSESDCYYKLNNGIIKFPEKWEKNIEQTQMYPYVMHGYYPYMLNKKLEDPNSNKDDFENLSKRIQNKIPQINNIMLNQQQDKHDSPCEICPYKDKKVEIQIEEILEQLIDDEMDLLSSFEDSDLQY
jgi:hypothetical protein